MKKGFIFLSSIMLTFMFMLSSISVFAVGNNTWTDKAAITVPRYDHEVAILDGKIYVIGGYNSSGYLNSVEEYDPATDKWITRATMPTAKEYHQVAVVGGKIYVIGGQNSSGYLNSVEEYDPATNTWTTKAPMTIARFRHEVAVVDGKVYVIGGSNSNSSGYLNTVEEYDPLRDTWTSKASMSIGRNFHKLAVVARKIYAIGGYNGNYLNTVEEYDTEYSLPQPPAKLTVLSGNEKVDLSWEVVDSATSYNIKRSETSGGPYETIASNIMATEYTDTDVTNGTTYYYVVSAINETGESENSNEVSATPENPAITLEVTSVDKAKLGDEITANIVIHNAVNICAEDLKIAYDTSKLQFISAENADGMKIYKEDDIAVGIKRYITACLGKANAANGDKVLLKLKFKTIDKGEAKIDITNGRIADNATLEMDISQENCGEKTILIEGPKDVNRNGEYTLLDLGITAWYYGCAAVDTDSSKYDTDQVVNGRIDDDDLAEVVAQILANTNYTANI
ncbi:kelch repeat-containing protein [Ruminiclostridium josui]|uniref:kelch repeat-containing protein n=1 Tax=Ruminiclostridium josui TaxID=1499 RepID=UPI000466093F|nr:kelch repeat-containing protein [Ruminiclostridium josui]